MADMPTLEQFQALQQALAQARTHNEALAGELRTTTGELRIVRTERDLLKEQLNKFKRQLFAASSEATGQHQKDMFFNEAESLGAQAEPAAEEAASDDDKIDVPGHRRAKRGRKPLDPALPRACSAGSGSPSHCQTSTASVGGLPGPRMIAMSTTDSP